MDTAGAILQRHLWPFSVERFTYWQNSIPCASFSFAFTRIYWTMISKMSSLCFRQLWFHEEKFTKLTKIIKIINTWKNHQDIKNKSLKAGREWIQNMKISLIMVVCGKHHKDKEVEESNMQNQKENSSWVIVKSRNIYWNEIIFQSEWNEKQGEIMRNSILIFFADTDLSVFPCFAMDGHAFVTLSWCW